MVYESEEEQTETHNYTLIIYMVTKNHTVMHTIVKMALFSGVLVNGNYIHSPSQLFF